MTDSSPHVTKHAVRSEMLALRNELTARERVRAAMTIAARPLPVPMGPGIIVAGFSPIKSEIDPIPLMRRVAEAGSHLALPVVVGKGQPFVMLSFVFGEPLHAGTWGIREPLA